MPSATIRTARATSAAGQSFGTKPLAPQARAVAGEMRPAPEMSSTRSSGRSVSSRSQTSGPDSSPRKRSTSATSGA